MYQHILNFYHTFIEHLKDYNHPWEYSRRLNSRSKLVIHMWYHLGMQLHRKVFTDEKGLLQIQAQTAWNDQFVSFRHSSNYSFVSATLSSFQHIH